MRCVYEVPLLAKCRNALSYLPEPPALAGEAPVRQRARRTVTVPMFLRLMHPPYFSEGLRAVTSAVKRVAAT